MTLMASSNPGVQHIGPQWSQPRNGWVTAGRGIPHRGGSFAAMEPTEDRLGDHEPTALAVDMALPQWSQPRIGWVTRAGHAGTFGSQ